MQDVARRAMAEINRLMSAKSPAIAELFVPDALLVGSEPGEIARGRTAIGALFGGIHSKDYAISWDFPLLVAGGNDSRVWFFGEGHVVVTLAESVDRLAYRLSAVLVAKGENWRWELFHGSEPRV